MTVAAFLAMVAAAGLAGYAALTRFGLDDFEAWGAGRTAGLVVATLPAWWLGVAGVGWWLTAGIVLAAVAAVAGAAAVWRRGRWRDLIAAEAIFTVGMLLVVLIRLDHPQISGQEKPMDMGIIATLLRTETFPPPDMWLAGEQFPYYYWGALVWTVPIAATGIELELAYNLLVGLVGGLVFVTLWALGRRLAGGSHSAGLVAAFFGLFAGTPDGLRQLMGGAGIGNLDLWRSSRQHPDLITEFPLFTAWLGDLHPHLLSMPLAAAALLVAARVGRDGPRLATTLGLAALCGVTWSANPWAMPPTLAGIVLLILSGDGRWHWPAAGGGRRYLAAAGIALGGWLVTAPFHLAFEPFFDGIRPVFAWTAPATILLYGGHLLAPAVLAAVPLARPWFGSDPTRARALALAAVAAIVLAATWSQRPTLVLIGAAAGALTGWTVGRGDRAERPAVALAALGLFLMAVPEMVYVVDSYGDRLHRMNTVFKAWIQAWMVLAVALPALLRVVAPRLPVRRLLTGMVMVPVLPHLVGALLAPLSGRPLGMDGLAWLAPGDRAIVRHLRGQPSGTSLIEAVGGAYSEYARLSANSGVPAFLGWENHELVWRGHTVTEETARRRSLIEELYRSGDPARVRQLVADAGVDLVAIGTLERRDFPSEGLAAVRAAGTVELDEQGGVLVRFAGPGEVP